MLKFSDKKYDDLFRHNVDLASIRNSQPFKNWFPGGNRIMIPLDTVEPINDIDKEIIRILNVFGFTVTDYVKGYAEKDGKIYKIGKLLEKISRIESKKAKTPERSIRKQLFFERLSEQFRDSAARTNTKHDLTVIISCDPHDIAQMSYNRDWRSCMTLGEPGDPNKGGNSKQVFCEVAEGGLIAYLVKRDDHDIQHPLARVLIRRFMNDGGLNIAVPEETVYGNASPLFLQTVKNWLQKHQGTIPGMYRRKGMEWSDSFTDFHEVLPVLSDDIGVRLDQIENLLQRDVIGKDVLDLLVPEINNHPELCGVAKLHDGIERLLLTAIWNNTFVIKLSNKQIGTIIMNSKSCKKELAKRVSTNTLNSQTYDELKKNQDLLGAIKDEITLLSEELISDFSAKKYPNEADKRLRITQFIDALQSVPNYFALLKQNWSTIEPIMNGHIASAITHMFWRWRDTSPAALAFFKNHLLKYWDDRTFGIRECGAYLVSCGSRATFLLPFLIHKRDSEPRKINFYNFVIDAIQNNDVNKRGFYNLKLV